MSKARQNADNVAGDISAVTAGTGLTGGGSSGSISLSVDTTVVATTGNTLTMTNKTIGSGGLAFEGSTDDGFETTLTVVDPTLDRTITFPNIDGTVVTTGNLTDITSTGTLSALTVSGDITLSGTNSPGSVTDELRLILMGAL